MKWFQSLSMKYKFGLLSTASLFLFKAKQLTASSSVDWEDDEITADDFDKTSSF